MRKYDSGRREMSDGVTVLVRGFFRNYTSSATCA